MRHAAGYALAARGVFNRSIANTVVYTAVADKRIGYLEQMSLAEGLNMTKPVFLFASRPTSSAREACFLLAF